MKKKFAIDYKLIDAHSRISFFIHWTARTQKFGQLFTETVELALKLNQI